VNRSIALAPIASTCRVTRVMSVGERPVGAEQGLEDEPARR